jgi:chemotaxis protein MotA
MLVIIGWAIVFGAVFGGFALAGGSLGAMFQPVELLMIGGAAVGAFLVANPVKTLRATAMAMPQCFKGSSYTKERYLALMSLQYDLLQKVRKEGLMVIEGDIERPYESAIFQKYPEILADAQLVEFLTDYVRLMVSGNLNPQEIDNLMESEIDTRHAEGMVPVLAIQKTGDALPAFGIVVAVMGVVHTMASVGLPPAELGRLIAHALVGTFLGILLSYGFVSPLAALLEQKLNEAVKELQCIKVTLLASMNGYAPAIAIEFGRKVLFSTERPSFLELEAHVKSLKATR